jgi:hypothetical protein
MTENQAPVYVVVQKPPHGSKDDEAYLAKKLPRKTMMVLACLQLSACGLAALTQVLILKNRPGSQNSPLKTDFLSDFLFFGRFLGFSVRIQR